MPQRVLFECFLAFFCPKNAKKHSKTLQPPTPPHPDKPPRPSHPRGLDFGPFRLRLAPFGSVWRSVWLRFGSVSGLFRGRFGGVGWGRGGVGERGFCKRKEYHRVRCHNPGPFLGTEYTPARCYSEVSLKCFHVTEMRLNEIFQDNNSQTNYPCNSLNHKRIRDMQFM